MLTRFVPPQTPSLVIDCAALEANLDAMQALCDAAGVRLRPHGKMHKCSTLGRRQVERGAVGLCAQTVGEAEAFVAGGIEDVLITSPSAEWAAPIVAGLARHARIAATADHPDQIMWLDAAARRQGSVIDLVIDVDPGTHRTGARAADVVSLARLTDVASGLRFSGIQMYAGQLQHVPDQPLRRRAYDDVIARAARLVAALSDDGLPPGVVTGGGTGTHAFDLASGVFTELQAGSYALMDVEYEQCAPPSGSTWPFRQAVFVATRVVSANHKTHVTLDAGVKAMSMDGPPPRVAAGAAAGSRWKDMGDEHGILVHPAAVALLGPGFSAAVDARDADASAPWPSDAPGLGDPVWLQPGHCDPTINLYDAFYVVDADGTYERWPIDARRVTATVRTG